MGTTAKVSKLPPCDFNNDHGDARYDFRTKMGPWANGCDKCYLENRASGSLGTGNGQMLVVEGEGV